MNERAWHQANADQEAGETVAANLDAILEDWGSSDVADLARTMYKHVGCGPWLSVKLHDGTWKCSYELGGVENGNVRALLVGSIVEGSDAEVMGEEIDLLTVENPAEAFDAEVKRIDAEASALWDEANRDEDDE